MPRKSFRLAVIGLSLVDFFAALEVTALVVALPSIRDQFGITLAAGKNIIFAYLAMMLAALFVAVVNGKYLSQKVSPQKLLFGGLFSYAAGSAMAAIPGSFAMLILALVVQGFGAGLSFVGQLSFISSRWKRNVGNIMPYCETAMAAGIVSGPLLGGFAAQRVFAGIPGWRYIFILAGIASVCSFYLVKRYFKEKEGGERQEEKAVEHRRLFRGLNYTTTLILQGIVILVSIGMSFSISLYLQDFLRMDSLASGFIIFFASLGSVAGAWISRTKVGPVSFIKEALNVVIIGSLFIALSVVSGSSWFLVVPIFIFGVGLGMANISLYVHFAKMDIDFRDNALFLIFFQAGNILGVTASEIAINHLGSTYGVTVLALSLLGAGVIIAVGRFLKKIEISGGKDLKVNRHDGIADEQLARKIFDIYQEAMEYANQVSPIQQSYTHWDEFKEIVKHRELITLALQYRGETIGMAMITANIDLVPWANTEFFKRKMNNQYEQRVIYYVKALNVLKKWRSQKRGAYLLKTIIDQVDYPHGVAVFDCSENATGDISNWVRLMCGDYAKIAPLDRQLFYVCSWDV